MGDQMTHARIIQRLEATPVWLRECFDALGAEEARVPADGEWSAAQILLHMRVSTRSCRRECCTCSCATTRR